ncbi:MAG TPA: hypothetical protein VKY37_11750 [Brumimicrobium sp.]|nr:hypothetical protein [Brumimicrobium sp.]
MKYILTLGLLLPFILFSQEHQYSYGFSGDIDSEHIEELSQQIAKIKGVKEVKARYKEEKKMGEMIIFTIETRDENNKNPFSPTLIKEIFINNKLTPLDFIKLN